MNAKAKAKAKIEAPKIRHVRAARGRDHALVVAWADGSVADVDVTEPIFRLKHFRPLRNRDRFRKVRVGDWGWAVTWGDGLDLSHERLWTLAKEQAKVNMTPGALRAWLRAHELDQGRFAKLLGISRRSVVYYATGRQPITRLVALAMKGIEREMVKSDTRSRRASRFARVRGQATVKMSTDAIMALTRGES
jgi:hypothetical protein